MFSERAKIGTPDMRGKVDWRGGGVGYRVGLEELEKVPLFQECGTVYWFCREVAIAKKRMMNPEDKRIGEQSNVLVYAQELLDKNQLTIEQLNYIYGQFEFDVSTYEPYEKK